MRMYTSFLLTIGLALCCSGRAYAGPCDLSTTSTCSVSFNGTTAIFTTVMPTGTYTIDPFLQLKGDGTEQGYNTTGDVDTSADGQQFQFAQQTFSDALMLSDVQIVTRDGIDYREFLLTVSEPKKEAEISLDQLRIFLAPTSSLTSYDTSSGKLGGLTAIYDLDAGTDNALKLNYSVGGGGGGGTMVAYIPNSLFTQSSSTQYVYLYSQFSGSNGGAEEWWVRSPSLSTQRSAAVTPEPGTLLLLGSALSMAGLRLRNRRRTRPTA